LSAPDTAAADDARQPWSREVNAGDRIFRFSTGALAAIVLVVLVAMAIEMLHASQLTLRRFGFGFITSTDWDPVTDSYGALPFIFGTIVSSIVALVFAVPIALGVAIFLSELAPAWLRRPLGTLVELLAGIPSVVYGLWGIFVLSPFLRNYVQPVLGNGRLFLGHVRQNLKKSGGPEQQARDRHPTGGSPLTWTSRQRSAGILPGWSPP